MTTRRGILATVLAPGLAAPALAQGSDFPNRPLRLIVPFPPGGGAALTALLAGEVNFLPALTGVAKPLAQERRLRALATTSATRLADFPDVPTTAELGLPAMDLVGAVRAGGAGAGGGTHSRRTGARLARDADWLRRLDQLAIEPASLDGPATALAVTQQIAGWRRRLVGLALQ